MDTVIMYHSNTEFVEHVQIQCGRLQLSDYNSDQITIIKLSDYHYQRSDRDPHQHQAFGEQGSGLTSSMYECMFVSLLFSKIFHE